MTTFANIKELLLALSREEKLLSEMFQKRKTTSYQYDYALALADYNDQKIRYLIDHAVLRQNDNYLEIDDLYLQFFEEVLGANEEISTAYINENLEKVTQNIAYYFNEDKEQKRYEYLRIIKRTLRNIGIITIRNVVGLKKNVDNTFKNEPNYKNKTAKLKNLDEKRENITKLILQADHLISKGEVTFFKVATDEELNRIIVRLKTQLGKCTHNLIETEHQIIDFLNQIQQQSNVLEKLKKIKYLKDQFILATTTNIKEVLSANDIVAFEPRPSYPLKLSLDFLQSSEEGFRCIQQVAARLRSKVKLKQPLAEKISAEYLETQVKEEVQVNLEEVKNSFVSGGNHLFDFVQSYDFLKPVSFEERVTIYCQLVSQYEAFFNITADFETKDEFEFAIVYPK